MSAVYHRSSASSCAQLKIEKPATETNTQKSFFRDR